MSDTRLAEAMEAAARSVRHGVNNQMMVLLGNLDLLANKAEDGSPAARQIGRAREAADRMAGLLGAYLALPRDAGVAKVRPRAALAALLPLLESAAGRGVSLEGSPEGVVAWPRPELPLALLGWAMEAEAARAAGAVVPGLVLHVAGGNQGLSLAPEPPPRDGAAFATAATAAGGAWDGTTLRLPGA
ncbi:hypothetical protein C8P66_107134 [Humitalea rosea]|uniref:histidine kinase n=1 Tax=Humitalea rosea TaxID=990373 RepID=A0A2W7J726_9PROT|nr:hypothetical protein [Humitalea rosea]PZW47096.1 hypothetical protein C8P66_107134 [Humitalea rosea]